MRPDTARYLAAALCALFLFTGGGAGAAPAPRAIAPVDARAAVAHAPFLRGVMPREAYGYLRIPNPWAVIGQPTGTAFDRALGSAPYAAVVALLRGGLADLLLDEAPPESRELLLLLLGHARSPLELAVAPAADPAVPFPDVFVSLDVDFGGPDRLNAFLAELARAQPLLQLEQPVDDAGFGLILAAGFPLRVGYDAARDRLMLYGGAAPTRETLNRLMRSTPPGDHPMHALERRLDSGGQGLFAWVAPQPLLALMERTGQQQQVAGIRAMGGSEVQALAVGAGTADGLQRVRVVLQMPEVGLRTFLPALGGPIGFAAAGVPDSAAVINLPSVAQAATVERALAALQPPDGAGKIAAAKAKLRERIGFGYEEFFAAVGPEMVSVGDAAGSYSALRLRDRAAFERIVAALAARDGARLEERKVGGRTYRHLVIPPLFGLDELASERRGEIDPLVARLLSMPGHAYFTIEGDYVLIGGTPQVLLDRAYVAGRTPVARWLKEVQRMDPSGALLLVSGRSTGIPRTMYQGNLILLQLLGDLLDRPVDLFALPSATEAGLPDASAYGFRVDSTPDEVALELAYTHNPLELFAGGSGMAGVAAVGILAAVAIPAYQDYTVRANVTAGYAATGPLRDSVAGTYLAEKRLLDDSEAAALVPALPAGVTLIGYNAQDGTVSIEFATDGAGTLTLTPKLVGDEIVWECGGTLAQRRMPRACR